ncbi:MAG: 50S ribosomal protein L20 [candidate division BRC1 bacterium ADurb.BinA364]|nr:MAG: 50S ribosomal protein L20 [candidate division BRC1 bacterium ADurb.BinA364]
MPRATNGVATRRRRKRILKLAKGYIGARRRLFKNAKETVRRALRYAFRDRRKRKAQMRALWIVRVNALSRQAGLSYSKLMHGLSVAGIAIDRKMLAEMAFADEAAFFAIVEKAKSALAKTAAA